MQRFQNREKNAIKSIFRERGKQSDQAADVRAQRPAQCGDKFLTIACGNAPDNFRSIVFIPTGDRTEVSGYIRVDAILR